VQTIFGTAALGNPVAEDRGDLPRRDAATGEELLVDLTDRLLVLFPLLVIIRIDRTARERDECERDRWQEP
jgi:hypothetical protein